MAMNVQREVAALERLTVGELRERFAELFGETTRTGNRTWLIRRIAWRLQARVAGGLSEAAQARAAELVDGTDLRVTAPREGSPVLVPPPQTGAVRDPRLPPVGTVLARKYKGTIIRVEVRDNGFVWDGRVFGSLSAVAQEVTGSHCNGFSFFQLTNKKGQS
ncbi:MAG: DUF2924 domain-containing protein [Bacteroidales bacterium]|nr:DUF2924 domain-containing protein [Bacteroidales bacterium]